MTETPTNRPAIDWQALETEFVNGFTSYEDLATTHGVHAPTLRKRAERGGWTAKRHELAATVTAHAQASLTSQRVDALSALHNQALSIAKTVNDKITAALASNDLTANELRTLTGAAKTALDLGKGTLEASPEPCKQTTFNPFGFDLDLSFLENEQFSNVIENA
jgi:hypothetical protein